MNKYLEKIASKASSVHRMHRLATAPHKITAEDVVETALDIKDKISAANSVHDKYKQKLNKLHARRHGLDINRKHR